GLSTPISVLMAGDPVSATGGGGSDTGVPGGTVGESGDDEPMETDSNGLVPGNGSGCGCAQGDSTPPLLALGPLMLLLGLRRRRSL
nr:hypothetical protein [Deltaproteobacteria bacterium]